MENNLYNIDDWFLVDIIIPMSTKFKVGMSAWCRYTSIHNDFKLRSITDGYEQTFGFAYNSHFKIRKTYDNNK